MSNIKSTINVDPILAILVVFGGVFTAFTFSDFVNIPAERFVVKSIGVILISIAVLVVFFKKEVIRLKQYEVILIYLTISFYSLLFLSEFFSEYKLSYVTITNFLRLAASLLMLGLLFSEKKSTYLVYTALFVGVLISLISIVFFLLDIGHGEKMPIIDIYSSKSIIFEQNVFGILSYLSLILLLFFTRVPRSLVFILSLVLIIGIFLSFYRTVWILSLLVFFYFFWKTSTYLRVVLVASALIGVVLFISNFELLYEVLKLEQLSTLTGRTELWRSAFVGINDYPIFGSGESSIRYFTAVYGPREFTTYHNVIVDILGMTGFIGLLIYSTIVFLLFYHARDKILMLLIWAPAMSNTFFIFSPNPLGLLSGIMTIILINKEIKIGK